MWLNGGLTLLTIGDYNVTVALNLTSDPEFTADHIQFTLLGIKLLVKITDVM